MTMALGTCGCAKHAREFPSTPSFALPTTVLVAVEEMMQRHLLHLHQHHHRLRQHRHRHVRMKGHTVRSGQLPESATRIHPTCILRARNLVVTAKGGHLNW